MFEAEESTLAQVLLTSPESRRRSASVAPRGHGGESRQTITPQFVFHCVRQWWRVATPLGLILATLGGTAVFLLFKPVYEASAWLRINESAPYVVFEDREPSRQFVQTQMQLIRSPLVLGPVVGQPEVAGMPELAKVEDPVTWLGEKIQVVSVGSSELFKISMTSSVPKDAANAVNAVAHEYFILCGQEGEKQNQRVIDLLTEEKDRREADVTRLRENVRELAKEATGKDPFAMAPSTADVASHPLSDLENRLTTAEVEQEVLKAQIEAYKKLASEEKVEISTAMTDEAVDSNVEVQQLKSRIEAKRLTLNEVAVRSAKGERDPAYLQLSKAIAQDEETLAKFRDGMRERAKTEMEASVKTRRQEDLVRMQSELDEYEIIEQWLRQRYDEKLADVKSYSGDTLNLQFKQAELARAEEVLNLISQRVLKLRTEQRAPARVTLMQPAVPPKVPVEVIPYKKLALTILAGFWFPFALAFGWEYLIRRVNNIEQLEDHGQLKVVAEIARLPVRTVIANNTAGARVGRDLMIFEESIDGLRTSLMLSEQLKDMKVLAVTSATTHEGKTSVAAQLAVSIARALGEETLLIDGDMRSPDIHKIFEVPLEPGLAGVLGKECEAKDAVVTNWGKYVHLLPAGKLHKSPHKLLGNGELKALLDEMRPRYRYIIIDTPPILAASEALVLAKAADGALICTMRNSSRLDQVRRAYDRLVHAGVTPIGTVLNGVPAKQYSYRYGTYAYSSD